MVKCRVMRLPPVIVLGLIYASLGLMFWLHRSSPWVIDEPMHLAQVQRFAQGDFTLDPHLAMTPGYHVLMAGCVRVLGADSVVAIRLISLVGIFAGIAVFFALIRQLWPGQELWRTVQFAFFPLFFPFHFLAYTDLWGVMALIGAFYLAVRSRSVWCGLWLLIAVAIRPTNIIWAPLLGWILVGDWPQLPRGVAGLRVVLQRTWMVAVTCLVFVGFVVWNGGVAVGDRELQQPGWNPTHGWFFLALFGLLFAPQCVEGIRQVWSRGRSCRMRAALVALVASALFGATFGVRHPFNQMNQGYVLHNILLCAVATMPIWRVLSLLIPPFALAGLLLSPLAYERYRWWVVLALVPLMGIPHVDTRYDMVPLVLFLILRAPASRAVETGMTLAYVALALWINAVSFGFVYYP